MFRQFHEIFMTSKWAFFFVLFQYSQFHKFFLKYIWQFHVKYKCSRKVSEFPHCASFSQLTPKAEYLLVRLLSTWSRKTSDWGRGGFLGLRITLTSCLISSSKSLESEDTDNTLGPIQELSSWSWTWSWASLEFDVVQCWSMSQESDFRGQPWSDPWSRSQPEKKGINANWNLRSLSSTVLSFAGGFWWEKRPSRTWRPRPLCK